MLRFTINPNGRRWPDHVGLEYVNWYEGDDPIKEAHEDAYDRARVWAGDTDYFPPEWAESAPEH